MNEAEPDERNEESKNPPSVSGEEEQKSKRAREPPSPRETYFLNIF